MSILVKQEEFWNKESVGTGLPFFATLGQCNTAYEPFHKTKECTESFSGPIPRGPAMLARGPLILFLSGQTIFSRFLTSHLEQRKNPNLFGFLGSKFARSPLFWLFWTSIFLTLFCNFFSCCPLFERGFFTCTSAKSELLNCWCHPRHCQGSPPSLVPGKHENWTR